jgi:hypothetical protein
MDFYEYQRLVGKISDIPELRNEFIAIFDTKSKNEMAVWGLKYGQHILEITGFEKSVEISKAFEAVQEWIDGKTNYHKARNITFSELYKEVRETNDIVKKKFVKILAQITCIPHVKFHALWATDMAITLINAVHPNSLDEVRKEREFQIELLKTIF